MSTSKMSTVQNCLLCKMYTPKMSAVAKYLLCQNVYCAKMSTPKNIYVAKMSTVPKCPLPKCLPTKFDPEGPFGKEISLKHKEFRRYFGIFLKTLQPVLTVYNEFVFWIMYGS